jgi:hypothetical protein
MSCRVPCKTCPWRKDQHADEIPNFHLDLAEGLVRTTETNPEAPIFACHQSKFEGQEIVCVGWLWRYGWDSIQIRLRLLNGKMQGEELEIQDGFDDLLHQDFDELIAKLREDVG